MAPSSSCCCMHLESGSLSQVLPDELVVEILSYLPVNSLLRFTSVSKSWDSLIRHPNFANLHLHHRSLLNHIDDHDVLLIIYLQNRGRSIRDARAAPCNLHPLLNNPSLTLSQQPYFPLTLYRVVDSCNGLVCLCPHPCFPHPDDDENHVERYQFLFWNPATRAVSKTVHPPLLLETEYYYYPPAFGFGYDNSADAYTALTEGCRGGQHFIVIKLYTLGHNCWRDIFTLLSPDFFCGELNASFLNCTLNLLAFLTHPASTHRKRVIVSFDLQTQTYKKLLLPRALYQLPLDKEARTFEKIRVLRGRLCFFHNLRREARFILWRMNEFGVQDSWTQLVNIPIRIDVGILPLCISDDDNVVVMLSNHFKFEAVYYYTTRDNTMHKHHSDILSCLDSKDYVQSLVLPY